ncbi:sensor histidine kinase [Rhodococcus aerolatus]
MRRLSLWLRERPGVGDGLLALVVLLLDLPAPLARDTPWVAGAVGVVLVAGIALRRSRTRLAAVLVLLGGLAQLVLLPGLVLRGADLAFPVVLYTLVPVLGRRVALAWVVVVAAGVAVWSVVRVGSVAGPVLPALVLALAWALAEFVGARRAYDAEVAARLSAAAADRDRRTEEAVAAERRRMARELHDVVAHAVSVVVVQADGAASVLDRDPEAARRAMGAIASTGRQALAELRRTVLALRSTDEVEVALPTGTAGLSELAQQFRTVGLPVELELTGPVDDLPAGIAIAVHRVVGEALTNVLRHAGPGAGARVEVRRGDDAVSARVTDTGGERPGGRGYAGGTGVGLVGMRERVAVLDGTLEVGPWSSRGEVAGWRVSAVLPLG